jgi:hypothetical protein
VPALSTKAKILVGALGLAGAGILARIPLSWGHPNYGRFAGTLLVAIFAARLRVALPRTTGSMSVDLPFILLALSELSLAEALLITAASTLAQCLGSAGRKTDLVKTGFNLSVTLMAAQAAWLAMQVAAPNSGAGLALGALAYLLVNTVPVAAIIAMTEHAKMLKTWGNIFTLTFPYFALAGGIAGLARLASQAFSWYVPLLILPVMFMVQRSFAAYFRALRGLAAPGNTMAAAAGAGRS